MISSDIGSDCLESLKIWKPSLCMIFLMDLLIWFRKASKTIELDIPGTHAVYNITTACTLNISCESTYLSAVLRALKNALAAVNPSLCHRKKDDSRVPIIM